MRRLLLILTLAFAIGPLTGGAAHAGTTCDTVVVVGTKAGVFPLYMHQEDVENAWRFACANTP
jgi:hypothetical protein